MTDEKRQRLKFYPGDELPGVLLKHGLSPLVALDGATFKCYWQSPCARTGQAMGWWLEEQPKVEQKGRIMP